MRAALIIVCGFVAACLGTPIGEKLKNDGKSCTLACVTRKINPVCGSDGRTYKNPCMLNAQNCGSPITLVEELREGVCSAEPTAALCEKIREKIPHCLDKVDPLCGQDGHTYNNYCMLLQANCDQKIGIGIVHRGACDSENRGIAAVSPVMPESTTWVGETTDESTPPPPEPAAE